MFSFFQKKTQVSGSQTVTLKLKGLHCPSCAINIDDVLEEHQGVLEATTNYAQSQAIISYDPQQVTISQLKALIAEAGYQVESSS